MYEDEVDKLIAFNRRGRHLVIAHRDHIDGLTVNVKTRNLTYPIGPGCRYADHRLSIYATLLFNYDNNIIAYVYDDASHTKSLIIQTGDSLSYLDDQFIIRNNLRYAIKHYNNGFMGPYDDAPMDDNLLSYVTLLIGDSKNVSIRGEFSTYHNWFTTEEAARVFFTNYQNLLAIFTKMENNVTFSVVIMKNGDDLELIQDKNKIQKMLEITQNIYVGDLDNLPGC